MDLDQALVALTAISQATRLSIVRLLVRTGPEGMPAGSIADAVGVSASNVSFHLKELEHADLIAAQRKAQSIIYRANYDTLRRLIGFLMKDCCGGRPEICSPFDCVPKTKAVKTRRRTHA